MNTKLKAKAITFGIILFVTSFIGALFFGGFLMPVLFISPLVYRYIFDNAIGSWEWLVAGLIEKWLGLNVIITGDRMKGAGEQCLIIMNHRTCLDWLYFWSVLVRQSGVTTEKIILKSPLKHIPGAGWAMQTAGFMFLKRRWDTDQLYLDKVLNYFKRLDYPTQILLFPEGTDLNERSRERSEAYAQKVGLGSYKNVLHPRTTGFIYLINRLKQDWSDAVVYDVTVGYPDNPPFPQTERDLLAGQFATSVHFFIQRHSIRDIPDDESSIDKWCRERWDAKEKQLDRFRVDGSFIDQDQLHGTSSDIAETSHSADVEVKLYAAIALWFVFVVLFVSLLVWSSLARWLALIHVCIFIGMDVYYGGFELFQAWYYDRHTSRTGVRVENDYNRKIS